MAKKPLTLSIVIPAYNEESHLKACLDSIAAQTMQPDEVIIVDNNSTDGTVALANTYAFVKVIHETEQGIVFARNAGFDAATGDIIGRIDADTILPPHWVHYVQKFYSDEAHQEHALTGGGYFYNIRLPKINGWLQGQLAFRTNRLAAGHYILWGSNMAVPAELWKSVRDDVCLRDDLHEDLDLAIHLHQVGYKITYREHLRVGVYLKRVWSNRSHLKKHIRRWPLTLRSHNCKLWWVAIIGNIFMLYVLQPIFFTLEILARVVGRPSITK